VTNSSASNGNGRLDRIEANLETVSETLLRVARVVEGNREDIDQIFERLDQLSGSTGELRQSQQVSTERFDGLAQSQQALTTRFDTLTQRFDDLALGQRNLQGAVEQLTSLMAQFTQNAEADRAFMRELQTEVRGLQSENQRILEYLFGQQGDGGDLLG
jgi:chromosome segregation ATPase